MPCLNCIAYLKACLFVRKSTKLFFQKTWSFTQHLCVKKIKHEGFTKDTMRRLHRFFHKITNNTKRNAAPKHKNTKTHKNDITP